MRNRRNTKRRRQAQERKRTRGLVTIDVAIVTRSTRSKLNSGERSGPRLVLNLRVNLVGA